MKDFLADIAKALAAKVGCWLIFVLLACLVMGAVYIVMPSYRDSSPGMAILGSIDLLIIAIFLHYLRKRKMFAYGIGELIIGMMINGVNVYKLLSNQPNVSDRLIFLVTGVYLTKRGFDTVMEANKNEGIE